MLAMTGGATDQPPVRWASSTIYGALAIFALLLVLACATGLMGADDLRYARYAQAVADGEYKEAVSEWRRHNALRYGVILPVAVIYKAFGVAEWSTMILPLLASTLSVVLLVEVGKQLFGLRVGVIAGLLYATFPLRLIFGAVLIPELIAECYVLLGVLCYLQARRHGGVLWPLAGLLMGASYLAKEPGLFIAGAFFLHAIWKREWRGALTFALGVAAVGIAEHAYYFLVWNDILFRVHITQPYMVEATPNPYFAPLKQNLAYFVFRKYPEMIVVPNLKFGLHSLACVVCAAAALLLKPRRGYLLVVLWILIPGLYLNFGSFSFHRYAPLPRDERYLEFIYPPLMLLTGVTLSRFLATGRLMARAVPVLLAVVMLVGVASGLMWRGQIAYSEHMAVLREIVRAVRATPGTTIHTADARWNRALRILDSSLVSASPKAATFILTNDALGLPTIQPGPSSHHLQEGQ
jgi:4-amino-4-deoxy-L-arabinose transferase-like glycosyltransferase